MVAKQSVCGGGGGGWGGRAGREGSLSFSAFPHQCKEMCDESQVNMEIIINYAVMDRNALFWLGNQLVSSGGLPDVKNKEECVCVRVHVLGWGWDHIKTSA